MDKCIMFIGQLYKEKIIDNDTCDKILEKYFETLSLPEMADIIANADKYEKILNLTF